MDGLLIHSPKHEAKNKLEILFKALIIHGWKLSPKKTQLFQTDLNYMGHMFTI